MNELESLFENLRELRRENINVEEFHQWMKTLNEESTRTVPKGILLKLKHGDMNKILSASKAILPSCLKCSAICKEHAFYDRSEHAACASAIDQALQAGILRRLAKPKWYVPSNTQPGADAYFACSFCGSIWNLVEPERQYNGLWERIA